MTTRIKRKIPGTRLSEIYWRVSILYIPDAFHQSKFLEIDKHFLIVRPKTRVINMSMKSEHFNQIEVHNLTSQYGRVGCHPAPLVRGIRSQSPHFLTTSPPCQRITFDLAITLGSSILIKHALIWQRVIYKAGKMINIVSFLAQRILKSSCCFYRRCEIAILVQKAKVGLNEFNFNA